MDKVKVGIIGCGGMAQHHARRFSELEDSEVVALCDVRREAAEVLQDKCLPEGANVPIFTDYREMIDSVELDAVAIITPHTLHFPQADYALEKGLHVLVEKPMTCNAGEAQALVDKAEQKGLVLEIAFPGPFSAEFRYAQQLIKEGGIGEVTMVIGFLTQNWTPVALNKWRGDPELSGGGQLYDSGSHLLNAMLYITDFQPAEVFAMINNEGLRVDVNSALTIRFTNDVVGSIGVSGKAACMQQRLVICGTDYVITTCVYGRSMDIIDPKGRAIDFRKEAGKGSSPQENFIKAIKGEEEVICPGIYGVRLALLMDAAYESARTQRPSIVATRVNR